MPYSWKSFTIPTEMLYNCCERFIEVFELRCVSVQCVCLCSVAFILSRRPNEFNSTIFAFLRPFGVYIFFSLSFIRSSYNLIKYILCCWFIHGHGWLLTTTTTTNGKTRNVFGLSDRRTNRETKKRLAIYLCVCLRMCWSFQFSNEFEISNQQ